MPKRPTEAAAEIRIAAVAVEDDDVLSTVAIGRTFLRGRKTGGTFKYDRLSEPQRTSRSDEKYAALRETGDFTSAVLVPLASDFLERLAQPPHVFGVSTHGRVAAESAFIIHEPARGPNAGKGPVKLDLGRDLQKPARGARIVAHNDATAAALGEFLWGAFAQDEGRQAFVYVWVGRGINAGIIIDGEPWQGALHPEVGHILARRYKSERGYVTDRYPGRCPQHGDCIQGLAGYSAFLERVEKDGRSVEEALDMVAFYVAQLCAAVTFTVVPRRIAIGGSTMRRHSGMLERIRDHYPDMVRGFPGYDDKIRARNVIVPAMRGDTAALLGMLEIARRTILPDFALVR